jgi:hypothetical protein
MIGMINELKRKAAIEILSNDFKRSGFFARTDDNFKSKADAEATIQQRARKFVPIERIGEGGKIERIESEIRNEYSVTLLINYADGSQSLFDGIVSDDHTVDDMAAEIDFDCEMNGDVRVISFSVCG